MEKSLKLRLHSNGNWSNLDDNGGDKLGFELENNATTIKIQLPDETSNFSHYLEVELPDGTVLLSSAIEEQLVDSIRTLVIPVGYPLTAQFGRVRIQYVGRKTNETIRSKVLPLDIDESVDGFVAGNSNPDFISWTEQHINDLTTRVTALEEGEAAARVVGQEEVLALLFPQRVEVAGLHVEGCPLELQVEEDIAPEVASHARGTLMIEETRIGIVVGGVEHGVVADVNT